MTKETFNAWMKNVDNVVHALALVSVYDLPDMNFRDAYDDNATPWQMGKEALRYAGFDNDND